MNEGHSEDTRDLELTFYRIELDGLWTLTDLYEFPHIYSQVYAFFYVLETPPHLQRERFADPFTSNPWVGGYDAVNFNHQLRARVPRKAQPGIVAIHYESPGWLDLSLVMGTAATIAFVVNRVLDAGEKINRLYSNIQAGIRDRRLAKLDIQRKELDLSRDQMRFAREASEELAAMMGLDRVRELRELTGDDLTTLKIVMAQFRRVRALARFIANGKIKL